MRRTELVEVRDYAYQGQGGGKSGIKRAEKSGVDIVAPSLRTLVDEIPRSKWSSPGRVDAHGKKGNFSLKMPLRKSDI